MIPKPEVQWVPLAETRPHPRNYRKHPADQLEHLIASIRQHGFYRNVVLADDGTVLAGHGVREAVEKMGGTHLPAIVLPVGPNSPAGLKVLAGDNEIGKLAETDDRALTEILRDVLNSDEVSKLLGTGFNEEQLAALVFTTRPASEVRSMDEAAAWVGMPAYEEGGDQIKLVITFKTDADRARFLEEKGIRIDKSAIKGTTWSTRWPWTDREDSASVRFVAGRPTEDAEENASRKFVVVTGQAGSGKSTVARALFMRLTALDPYDLWRRGDLLVSCACGTYGLAGTWKRSSKLPGGDFMDKADTAGVIAASKPNVLITGVNRFTLDLREDPRSRVVLLEVPRDVRERRIKERGTTLTFIDQHPDAALKGRVPDLATNGDRAVEDVVDDVVSALGLAPCECFVGSDDALVESEAEAEGA